MKKLLIAATIAFACAGQAEAQSFLNNLLSTVNTAAQQSATTPSNGKSAAANVGTNVLGSVLNNTVEGVANATGNSAAAGLIGNLISSVTGSMTTTQANLVGSWSYTEPCVQFESENLLTKAGGTTITTKIEKKLTTYYKLVGIKEGKLNFTFNNDGSCTYGVGSITRNGTYTFDNKEKTVTITTATGQTARAYVTISGNNMSLCFDGSKLLVLFQTISSKFSSLNTVSALASQYNGAKVGFKFAKK